MDSSTRATFVSVHHQLTPRLPNQAAKAALRDVNLSKPMRSGYRRWTGLCYIVWPPCHSCLDDTNPGNN